LREENSRRPAPGISQNLNRLFGGAGWAKAKWDVSGESALPQGPRSKAGPLASSKSEPGGGPYHRHTRKKGKKNSRMFHRRNSCPGKGTPPLAECGGRFVAREDFSFFLLRPQSPTFPCASVVSSRGEKRHLLNEAKIRNPGRFPQELLFHMGGGEAFFFRGGVARAGMGRDGSAQAETRSEPMLLFRPPELRAGRRYEQKPVGTLVFIGTSKLRLRPHVEKGILSGLASVLLQTGNMHPDMAGLEIASDGRISGILGQEGRGEKLNPDWHRENADF